jgi:hypothetical protein
MKSLYRFLFTGSSFVSIIPFSQYLQGLFCCNSLHKREHANLTCSFLAILAGSFCCNFLNKWERANLTIKCAFALRIIARACNSSKKHYLYHVLLIVGTTPRSTIQKQDLFTKEKPLLINVNRLQAIVILISHRVTFGKTESHAQQLYVVRLRRASKQVCTSSLPGHPNHISF